MANAQNLVKRLAEIKAAGPLPKIVRIELVSINRNDAQHVFQVLSSMPNQLLYDYIFRCWNPCLIHRRNDPRNRFLKLQVVDTLRFCILRISLTLSASKI